MLFAEDLITCYCNRPYAGRPMVECDSCLTWIHITCTDLKRRDRVPEVWHCYKCVEKRDEAKGNNQVKNCIVGCLWKNLDCHQIFEIMNTFHTLCVFPHRNSPDHRRERRPRAARGTPPTANHRPPPRPPPTPPPVTHPQLPSSPEGRSAIFSKGDRGLFPSGTTFFFAIHVPQEGAIFVIRARRLQRTHLETTWSRLIPFRDV